MAWIGSVRYAVNRLITLMVMNVFVKSIGMNVVVIPKSAGVTHEYFPTQPAGLAYLRKTLERTAADADSFQNPTASTDRTTSSSRARLESGAPTSAGSAGQ